MIENVQAAIVQNVEDVVELVEKKLTSCQEKRGSVEKAMMEYETEHLKRTVDILCDKSMDREEKVSDIQGCV